MFYENFFPFLSKFIQDLRLNPDLLALYLPLGAAGIWRWGTWLVKKFLSLFYRPGVGNFTPFTVSLVTPVYNENPEVFLEALRSWGRNNPEEIIAVIDYTDEACIKAFKDFTLKNPNAKLIVTRKPGKRAALAIGIREAKSDIVALVDSDTFWSANTLEKALSPFEDKRIGGVGTRQNCLNPHTLAQKIFDIQLDQRYFDEMPFLSLGGMVTCLSGRTAFYRREILLPLLPDLEREFFMGEPVISGDDKRLTYLIEKAGWKTAYQSNSVVFTPGMASFIQFFKQRVRWTRNSWRADLRAIIDGWVWRHPLLAFHLIDRIIQPFVMLIGPVYFFISLLTGFWEGAVVIFIWWHLSRFIRIFPHLRRRPQDILILPHYVLSTFIFAFVKIYALFTLNTQGWITRWHESRLPKIRLIQNILAYGATSSIFIFIAGSVLISRRGDIVPHTIAKAYPLPQALVRTVKEDNTQTRILGIKTVEPSPILIYETKRGESLLAIAKKYKKKEEELLSANISFLPDSPFVSENLLIAIPSESKENLKSNYHTSVKYYPQIRIVYRKASNTIEVSGRGNSVTLAQISNAVGKNYLEEISPGEWILRANLLIQNGVLLALESPDVIWLKLLSKKGNFVTIKIQNGGFLVDKVKISSWDEDLGIEDKDTSDGRSFMLMKLSSIVKVSDSDISYLGYKSNEEESFGFSFKIPRESNERYLSTGEMKNNHFHDNYVGMYLEGSEGMLFYSNKFFNNKESGLEISEGTKNILVESNVFFKNGKGIVLEKKPVEVALRKNNIFANSEIGVVFDNSENNIFETNDVFDNKEGIILKSSRKNIFKGNLIKNNNLGIKLSRSEENLFGENVIVGQAMFGVYFEDGADRNIFKGSTVEKNRIGLLIKTSDNNFLENIISKNRSGIVLEDNANRNNFVRNKMFDNRLYSILTKTKKKNVNYLVEN